MGKKKKVSLDDDEYLDDLEDGDFETEYPTLEKKEKESQKEMEKKAEEKSEMEEQIADFGLEIDDEIRTQKFKYVNPKIIKGKRDRDYEILMEGQSHGFCNILVKHILEVDGVDIAAYKSTGLEPAKIFIRVKDGYDIRQILRKGADSLRDEVIQVRDLFYKII
ncbi:MAG: RpoL/Rpb11 RNA polymerase subunit family protein [Promethearchaeia archaeon]